MKNMETVGEIMITEEQIRQRAFEIGQQISEEYAGEEIIAVGILRGAVMWMTDVIKNITKADVLIDFMVVSSYGSGTVTSGNVKIIKDIDYNVEGKNVIIVEDIVDSGMTLSCLKKYFQERNPKSLKICALLDKPSGRRTELIPDYAGFTVDDKFIVGYGLDYDQKYRNLPYISFLK